jgi:hypothetical protein
MLNKKSLEEVQEFFATISLSLRTNQELLIIKRVIEGVRDAHPL